MSNLNSGQLIPLKKTVRTVPPFEELTIVIFGIQGSGKTSFCNGDDNSITIAAEPGSDFIATRAVLCKKWDTFLDVVEEVKKGLSHDPDFCSGIVIDIADNLFEFCRDHVCRQLGIAYPGEKKDFGKSWSDISKEWKGWISYAMSFCNLRFITHMTEREIELKNEAGLMEKVNQLAPRFNGNQGAKFLDGICSLVGYMFTNKKGEYCITFKQTAHVAAKDRTGLLAPLGDIVLPSNPLDGFNHVRDLYTMKAREAGYQIVSRKPHSTKR